MILVALEVEGADGRTLLHHHHQGRFVAAQLHVAEEAGVIERAQRLANALAPMRSPMLTGSVLNTAPSLMRCSPSTRMSVTSNSSGVFGARGERTN